MMRESRGGLEWEFGLMMVSGLLILPGAAFGDQEVAQGTLCVVPLEPVADVRVECPLDVGPITTAGGSVQRATVKFTVAETGEAAEIKYTRLGNDTLTVDTFLEGVLITSVLLDGFDAMARPPTATVEATNAYLRRMEASNVAGIKALDNITARLEVDAKVMNCLSGDRRLEAGLLTPGECATLGKIGRAACWAAGAATCAGVFTCVADVAGASICSDEITDLEAGCKQGLTCSACRL